MNSDKFKRQIESMWRHRDTDEQKRLVKFTIAKTMRLALEYPEFAQEYSDSLCKVIPDNERITVSNYQHNLTSDEEGEELLTCEKYKVEEALNYCDELDSISGSHNMLNWGKHMIEYLFGSKCLLDAHEDNFAKTDLEPYTEQREDLIPPNSGELESQEADKQFNTIIKDSFAKERRLNIAAQIVASMVGSDDWTTWRGGTNKEIWHNMAKSSLEIADALIDECEKKGGIK